ncbi:hypothetical protein [Sulfuricella sp. T08]|uniref:hypothetical protein n=1 Tax=Sulfuricella sp. T08 TaxID=1632857 RepID=UPI00131F25C8|nr:hypothetical protein [Sulfuricella sp. T08]
MIPASQAKPEIIVKPEKRLYVVDASFKWSSISEYGCSKVVCPPINAASVIEKQPQPVEPEGKIEAVGEQPCVGRHQVFPRQHGRHQGGEQCQAARHDPDCAQGGHSPAEVGQQREGDSR